MRQKGSPKSHTEESTVNETDIYCNLKQFEAKEPGSSTCIGKGI
jgi:hypothetical protein